MFHSTKIYIKFETMDIIVSAIQPDFLPKQAHDTDAWYDVFSRAQVEIQPHTIENIPVWVKVAMPKWMVCLVFPRSSLPLKKGLMLSNSVWVIDAWYRGEIHMQLYNLNDEPVTINRWEKIWQLIFTIYMSWIVDDSKHYDDFEDEYPSDRWTWWFGSTGN